ncbi:DUF4296 domain-containing protein [Crocinitomix catalasitica]|nr:DUF4296 domain-containing protein [Crocinitomix catalasitica]
MKLVGSILLTVFLLGCSGDDRQPSPESVGVLSKPKLISLMVDLEILESHFHRLFMRPDKYARALDSSSVFIFEDHGTTKRELKRSLLYYSTIPDTMYSIYESALDSVNQRIARGSVSPE